MVESTTLHVTRTEGSRSMRPPPAPDGRRLFRDGRGERLARFDDVVGEHAGWRRGPVGRVVDGPCRDEEGLAHAKRHGPLASLFEQDRPFQDVADFLSRMCVPPYGR